MTKSIFIRRRRPSLATQSHRTLSGLGILFGIYNRAVDRQRRIDLNEAKLIKIAQDREIGEIILAKRHDELVLLDIEIEKKKLELIALQRKVGNPDDYAKDIKDV